MKDLYFERMLKMSKEINKMLEDEIERSFDELKPFQTGSKEKSTAIQDLETLYKLHLEEVKIDSEADAKNKDRGLTSETNDDDQKFKTAQLKEQTTDRYFRIGIEVAGIVLPLIFYGCWMKRGFKFEETGTFTSTTFRGLFGRFKPTNKN